MLDLSDYGAIYAVLARDFPVGLEGIATGKDQKVLETAMDMTLCCKLHEMVHHILRQVYVSNIVLVGYVNGWSYEQMNLEARANEINAQLQGM